MVKNVRIKVFKSSSAQEGMDVDIFMSERNVSDYEGRVTMKLTRGQNEQFVELEGGASSGCPDLYGKLDYKRSHLDFSACNRPLQRPWFMVKGKDGKEHYEYFDENHHWYPIIDGIKYDIVRLNDGDDCILFEMYVGL